MSLSVFRVTNFLQISGDPVDPLMFNSRASKRWAGSSVCHLGGLFCRVTRWAPRLFMGGPHIPIFAGLFSRVRFLSLETFPLLSCLGKGTIHKAATSLCCALVQFQKQASPLGG